MSPHDGIVTSPGVGGALRGDAHTTSARAGLKATTSQPVVIRTQRRAALITICVPLLGAVLALVLLSQGVLDRRIAAVFIVLHFVAMVGITSGYHRHFAHRSFKANRMVRALLIVMGSLAAQGPVIHWVANHRRHHQFSDRSGDTHSPHAYQGTRYGRLRGFWFAHIGWMFNSEATNAVRYAPDLLRDPLVRKMNRRYPLFVLLGLALPAALGALALGSWKGALLGFLWGGLFRIFTVHHATWAINSITHLYGTRPYKTTDKSTNNAWLAIPTAGESWHNAHHAFPGSARFGLSWWQLDIGYLFISGLKLLGLAWDVNLPSARQVTAKQAH